MFKRDGYLHPVLLQLLGIAMLIGFTIYWVIANRQSGLLVGAALTLIGVGSAGGALVSIRQDIAGRGAEHLDRLKEEAGDD